MKYHALKCISFIIVQFSFFVSVSQSKKKLDTVAYLDLNKYYPTFKKRDTIKARFWYEYDINSYNELDQVLKPRGFVKIINNSFRKSYSNGLFYCVPQYLYQLQKTTGISYDASSIEDFYRKFISKSFIAGISSIGVSNPFCGCYYKSVDLNIEVIYLRTLSQRMPVFADCKELSEYQRKHRGKGYTLEKIPVYVITKVFSWAE